MCTLVCACLFVYTHTENDRESVVQMQTHQQCRRKDDAGEDDVVDVDDDDDDDGDKPPLRIWVIFQTDMNISGMECVCVRVFAPVLQSDDGLWPVI